MGNDIFTAGTTKRCWPARMSTQYSSATPDHWHAKIAIDAMEAGKDVYCEKPMVQKIEDGKRMMDAQKHTGRIIQVGSQRVSSIVYQKAKDLIRAGRHRRIKHGGSLVGPQLGHRGMAIFDSAGCLAPDHRLGAVSWTRAETRIRSKTHLPMAQLRDYGTGVAGDLFVHFFSGMHFITGAIGPTRVYAAGGLRFWKDGRDVPDVLLGLI